MTILVPLSTCLRQALLDLQPVAGHRNGLVVGAVLAEDLCFPADCPAAPQAVRAGLPVNSLALMGASAQMPIAIGKTKAVEPGEVLPQGCDAVLPADAIDDAADPPQVLREAQPGEGMRRAGHDGRSGELIANAGQRLNARTVLVARLAGLKAAGIRQPRVQVTLPDPEQARFASLWAETQGAVIVDDQPDLLIRPEMSHRPKLALAPGETAWLGREGMMLVLDMPPRFDGMLAALLALGLPALAALTGSTRQPRPVSLKRKVTSTIGMSELVLLRVEPDGWQASAPGLVTLSALARSHGFALIPPETEGYPAGTQLPAFPLDPDQDSP